MSADADAAFGAFIDRVRAFGANVRDEVAKAAAPLVMVAAQATAAAGLDPYGASWRPRKDGSRAIPEAAAAVDVVARGPIVVLRVYRGAAIQNYLSEKNRRQVIPDASKPIPAPIVAALQEGASRVFRKAVG